MMTKFKLTFLSGMVVEHYSNTMIDAIRYVEDRYKSIIVKVEMIV